MIRFRLVAATAALAVAGCSPAPPAPAAEPAHHHHDTVAASGQPAGHLVVRADDQLKPVLGVLTDQFEEAFPGTDVAVEYGTGKAAADVLVTDDPGAVDEATVVARNPLVIATARTATTVNTAADLRRPGVRVAVGGDAAGLVPATVRTDGPGAVAAVVTGAADVAVVHRTDVVAAGADLRVVDFREGIEHADQYVVVLTKPGGNPVTADAFRELMRSALAQRVFSDAGFSAA
ncbi:substrate-binding domain-containing protein [Actinoplanes oblitus]|uniref:Substrate-binding domain-containing protein n=1 Tax=Actinoplanes oblitus TaxID=3040509 RepID=A0ABY8WR48_9ACTN|nr:substrate-binding domain-containing protein [Actinoplanes oblitus]WIN00331.1 substrate-binding domain-containing protein [Actinoplanes oblitus]